MLLRQVLNIGMGILQVAYYLLQMKSSNDEIRKAGLHCINELALKVFNIFCCVYKHVVSLYFIYI